MDHMESYSPSNVKALDKNNKQDGADTAAKIIKATAAENLTNTSVGNLGSVSMFLGCPDESTSLEDVKVCDICGDAGREHLLATCSKCSDGAEHTYCMRIRLEKVPDANWICEDCVLSEEKDKRRLSELSDFAASPKYSIYESEHDIETPGASDTKVNPISHLKGPDIDTSRRDKLSSLSSPKSSLGNAKSALLTRRKALGLKSLMISKQHRKAPKSHEFSLKSSHASSSPKNLSGRSMGEKRGSLTVSGQCSPKSHQLLTSSGLLVKSKSFNGSARKPKVQFLEKYPEKQKLSSENAVGTKGKGGSVGSLKKSLSFGDAIAGHSNELDIEAKTCTPKLSEVSDLKRLRHKECSSPEALEVKPVLKKPRIFSPDGLVSSASSGDRKCASHCEHESAHFSGIKCSDIETVQNSTKSASPDEVKKLSTNSNLSQEPKHKDETSSSSFSRRHLSGSDATGQDKLSAVERPSHQNLKAPQISDTRLNGGHTSDGTGSAVSHKFDTVAHGTNCRSEDNSSVSVIAMGREKDLNKSCERDLASALCYHLNINGSLAVPMFDYIWKGEFKIQSSGRLPGYLCRIQAHLSTWSSPKIPEVVKKFSDKILLEEVSRSSTWPTQFLKYQPQEDSIGLYIFAQDIESYSKYKNFLQCMIDYDLALRGNFDGIEFLVFSSNLLPEKSQCWNKLLFLWGIFKQRKFITT